MRFSTALSLALIFAGLPLSAQESIEVPFYLGTPEGWRTETIPFPLDFAPELEYEGLEELRFSPGMFSEQSIDFWSYAFVWWVPEGTSFGTERLENDLEAYYRGLTEGVAKINELDPGDPEFAVQLKPVESASLEHAQWKGSVRTFDVFTTRKPIRLGIRIDILQCPEQERVAAFFQLSPQPERHKIWKVMDDLRRGFRCER